MKRREKLFYALQAHIVLTNMLEEDNQWTCKEEGRDHFPDPIGHFVTPWIFAGVAWGERVPQRR